MSQLLTIDALGKTWQLSPLRLGELRTLERLASEAPSPLRAARVYLGDDLRGDALAEAEAASVGAGRLGSPSFSAYLSSAEGMVQAVMLGLKIENPGLSADQLTAIAEAVPIDRMKAIVAALMGKKAGDARPTGAAPAAATTENLPATA